MQAKLQSERAKTGEAPPFSVVIAYEDPARCRDAEKILNQIWKKAGRGAELQTSSWAFDMLEHPEINKLAARDAAEADMIFICGAEKETLTRQLAEWVQSWIASRKDRPGALVALLDRCSPSAAAHSDLIPYFQNLARQGNLDFFSRTRVSHPAG